MTQVIEAHANVRNDIRSLLICDDIPSFSYGTGQRLMAHKQALSALGECRVLHLTNSERPRQLGQRDYVAPIPFDHRSSKLAWMVRNLTFTEFRQDRRYIEVLENIRKDFPYDIAFCSFFRTSCVAPTHLVPCLLDIDAFWPATSPLSRLLLPLTTLAIRRRARAFKAIYVARRSDKCLFGRRMLNEITVLPGISATARPYPSSPVRKERVLLVGSAQWRPNRDAIDWLLSIGTPQILDKMGHELRLVGTGTENIPEQPGLSRAGFIDDLALEYSHAKLVLCPIFSGGGANIKLAEAVQFGCPVLATSHAASGYAGMLVPGEHIEVFSTRATFIEKLCKLLQEPDRLNELREKAVQASQTFLNQDYCNKVIAGDVRRVLGSNGRF